jgi:hypothetical protein
MNTQIFENEAETFHNNTICNEGNPDIVIENVFGKRNLCDLERIRSIILIEEDKTLEVKDVLGRVLEHYNTYVHYR